MAASDDLGAQHRYVANVTRQMRLGETPEMARLRVVLQSKGINTARTACVDGYDDLMGLFVAVLVLPSREAIECALDTDGPDVTVAPLVDWHVAPSALAQSISVGVELLDAEEAKRDPADLAP